LKQFKAILEVFLGIGQRVYYRIRTNGIGSRRPKGPASRAVESLENSRLRYATLLAVILANKFTAAIEIPGISVDSTAQERLFADQSAVLTLVRAHAIKPRGKIVTLQSHSALNDLYCSEPHLGEAALYLKIMEFTSNHLVLGHR
jgi:hypothetical protein